VVPELSNGTACYLWVKAKNEAETSAFSARASGTPFAPSEISIEAPITIEYGTADIKVMQNGAPYTQDLIVLSKTGAGGVPQALTLEIDEAFTGVVWYVGETPYDTAGSSLTLNAAGFLVKDYSITVTAWRNGRYLASKPILFRVND
jgi:hypothetical protein